MRISPALLRPCRSHPGKSKLWAGSLCRPSAFRKGPQSPCSLLPNMYPSQDPQVRLTGVWFKCRCLGHTPMHRAGVCRFQGSCTCGCLRAAVSRRPSGSQVQTQLTVGLRSSQLGSGFWMVPSQVCLKHAHSSKRQSGAWDPEPSPGAAGRRAFPDLFCIAQTPNLLSFSSWETLLKTHHTSFGTC